MNFYDILLAKKLSGGGGGDITTEALNVTANGQYTAPQGKAYTPVNVNVAGYKVGEVETPTPIATFNGTANPLKSLSASIVPVQAGSGDPSPTNVRPISGWDEVNITVANDVDNPTVEHTYTIPFTDSQGQSVEVFGGSVDVTSGVLTVDSVKTSLPDYWAVNTESSTYWLITNTRNDAISVENTDTSIRVISDGFKGISANEMITKIITTDNINSIALISSKRLLLKVSKADYPTLNDLYSMIKTNNLQVIYELATPTTFYTQPTSIKSLDGENNVRASTGDVEELKYFEEL